MTYILTSTRRLWSKQTHTNANCGVVFSGGVFPRSIVRLDAKRARILPFSYFLPPLTPTLPPAERPPMARWRRGNGQGLLLRANFLFYFIFLHSLFTTTGKNTRNVLYCIDRLHIFLSLLCCPWFYFGLFLFF